MLFDHNHGSQTPGMEPAVRSYTRPNNLFSAGRGQGSPHSVIFAAFDKSHDLSQVNPRENLNNRERQPAYSSHFLDTSALCKGPL